MLSMRHTVANRMFTCHVRLSCAGSKAGKNITGASHRGSRSARHARDPEVDPESLNGLLVAGHEG